MVVPLSVVVALGFLAPQEPPPQNPPRVTAPATGFLPRTIEIGGAERRYVVYVPPGYDPARAWPLLLFLNGMGECGTDGQRQVEVGLGPAIRAEPERWPFVVAFPQKPDRASQWHEHEDLVMGTLAATEREFRIDPQRRYLTGLSQGGAGTWALGSRHADVWAALAPVCGYKTPPVDAARLKGMPIWAFHGEDDKVVPAQQSKELCAAAEAAGAATVLTLYPGVAHNSWDRAYRDSALAEWFRVQGTSVGAAHALAAPAAVSGALTVVVARRTPAGREVETLVLGGHQSWAVHREVERDGAALGAPGEVALARDRAAGLLHECLRTLVRGGLCDDAAAGDAAPPTGVDFVAWAWHHGVGDLPRRPLRYRHADGGAPDAGVRALLAVAGRLREAR
jgi:predicted esterase